MLPYPRTSHCFTHLTVTAAVFLLLAFSSQTSANNPPPSTTVAITILGHSYQALLQENSALREKIQGAAQKPGIADNTSTQARHYRGKLTDNDNSWVRLSFIDKQWQGVVSLEGSIHIIGQSAPTASTESSTGLDTALATFGLSSSPASAAGQSLGSCRGSHGSRHPINAPTFTTNEPATANSVVADDNASIARATFPQFCANQVAGVCLIAELEFAFDSLFQTLFGDQAFAQATSLINVVEGYYINDLNIAFNAITVELLNNELFSTTTDSGVLLDDIADKKANGQIPFIKNNRALFHLVTGRDFDDDTAGVAFLGTTCSSFGSSSGTSSVIGFGSGRIPFTALVVAHELGHNFGASHDGENSASACAIDTFIMSPSISSNVGGFSSCSINDMQSHIATRTDSIDPALCFDFPADVAITADSNNPTTAIRSETFSSMYALSLQNSFQAVTQLQVQGTVDTTEGQYVSATANGAACSVPSGGATYSCNINNPGSSIALVVNALPVGTTGQLALTHTTSIPSADILDLNSANDVLTVNFTISEPPVPPAPDPAPAPAPTTSASSSGGGGGNIGWSLLAGLWLLSRLHRRL